MPANRSLDLDTVTSTAVALFNAQGYDGTSMETIAEQLGVTKAALYYHAPDGKQQILQHAMHRAMDPLWESLAEDGAREGSAADRLRYVLSRQVELVIEGLPDIGFFLLSLSHHPLADEAKRRRRAYDRALAELFAEAAEEGAVRADLDVGVVTRLVTGMAYSVNEWYREDGRLSPDQMRDTVLRVAFEGITPGA